MNNIEFKIFVCFALILVGSIYSLVQSVVHQNNERNFCLEKYDLSLKLDSKGEINGVYCKYYYEKKMKFEKEYKKNWETEKKEIEEINNFIN